jgi:uroporphyrinogen decarboxylase
MGIAAELAGGPQDLAALIAQDPASVHVGLQTITKTFAGFAARCVEAGADGIFLATTHCATRTNFTAAQYAEFGRPYDLEILRAVRKAPLNLLHVCRPHSMVRDLADYPVAMLNWDTADPSNPDLAALAPAVRPRRACRARAAGRKALVGGLNRKYFSETGGCEALLAEAEAARRAMGERPFVLGATCTIDPTSDPDTVMAIRKSVGP